MLCCFRGLSTSPLVQPCGSCTDTRQITTTFSVKRFFISQTVDIVYFKSGRFVGGTRTFSRVEEARGVLVQKPLRIGPPPRCVCNVVLVYSRAPPHPRSEKTRHTWGMEEDQSWLSSVIDRVDKLALSIVGYEDDPPGGHFSAFQAAYSTLFSLISGGKRFTPHFSASVLPPR